MQRRSFLGYTVLALIASAVPIACLLHEPDPVEPIVVEPAPDYPELPPIPSPRPLPRWDGHQAGNHAELRILYRTDCRRGDLEACDLYASMLRSGVGGRPEPRLALEVSSHACKRGHEDSCNLARAQRQRLGLPPPRLGELP
jgi:hypothetical protein